MNLFSVRGFQAVLPVSHLIRSFNTGVHSPFSVRQSEKLVQSCLQSYQKLDEVKKRVFDLYDQDSHRFENNLYSPANRVVRSWLCRQTSPQKLWDHFHSPVVIPYPFEISKVDVLSGLDRSSGKNANEEKDESVQGLHSFLERQGEPGLRNMSDEVLVAVADQFEQLQAYDAFVELVNCSRPSSEFTGSSPLIARYAFAHLKSSYVNPHLSQHFAKLILREEEMPLARYTLGISSYLKGEVAKEMADSLEKQHVQLSTIERYRECFPDTDCKALDNYERSMEEARKELAQTIKMCT